LLVALGRFDEAKKTIEHFRQLSSTDASPEIEWLANCYECRYALMDGRVRQADQIAASMLADSSQVSSGFGVTMSNITTGFVRSVQGDCSAATAAFKTALENCDRHNGFRYYRGVAVGSLTESLIAEKKRSEALSYAKEGVEFCRRQNSLHDLQPWMGLARVNILAGDESAVRAILDELQGLVTKTGVRLFQPCVHELRPEFSHRFGGDWSADHKTAIAHALYREVGNVNYVPRAHDA
jgi:ATP/maltotriose-dependent transcriptional regulator MalT